MDPRRLTAINQIPEAQRFTVVAEGLELLADNVATLADDAIALGGSRRHRGAAVLRSFAEEEAAKVLILMDLARAGWRNHDAAKKCMANFYSHLARGLYARAYDGKPASLAEVRGYIDDLRQEYYLDGPMYVDWIFGNEVNTDREQQLYVDYVVDEYGEGRWVGPAARAEIFDEPFNVSARTRTVVPLVAAMHRTGLLTEAGLAATRMVWDSVSVDDTTRWTELRAANVSVIKELASSGRTFDTEEDRDDLRCVADHWIFPLTSLDLKLAKVDRAELQRARERQLAREMGVDDNDGYGCGSGYI